MKSNSILKRVLAVALAAIMVLSMVACSGTTSVGASNSSGAAFGGEDSINVNTSENILDPTGNVLDELTIGVGLLWSTLSPFQTTQNQYGPFVRAIYDRLVVIADGEYIPQGAKSWTVADDGITWTVEIQDNMVDSAGNHITAEDVAWYMNEMMTRKLKPVFNNVASATATGEYTLEVIMAEDIVGNFELVLASTYVVSQKAMEASPDEMANEVVSTGPYEVVEFVSGSHLTLKKRADYWDADNDNPHLACNVENLTYQIITEASQQQIALETGTVDCFENINAALVSAFNDTNTYGIISGPSGNGLQMYFSGDASRAVAEDLNLRLAICYAIDIDGIIAAAYDGLAEPMHDGATNTLVGYLDKWDEEEYFPYDVELAKEYLEKSNYQGQELSLMCSNGTTMERLAQVLQAYLAAVGINLRLDIVDTALMSASRFDGAQYDMILINAGGIAITNFWGVRFDMNAYEKGDGTSRKDEVLTDMIYNTWKTENFTEENIDAIHVYVRDNAYAYGLVNPQVPCVYRTETGIVGAPYSSQGYADFMASVVA